MQLPAIMEHHQQLTGRRGAPLAEPSGDARVRAHSLLKEASQNDQADLFEAYVAAEGMVGFDDSKRLGDVFRNLWHDRTGLSWAQVMQAARSSGTPARKFARRIHRQWLKALEGGATAAEARRAIREAWSAEHPAAEDPLYPLAAATELLTARRVAEQHYVSTAVA